MVYTSIGTPCITNPLQFPHEPPGVREPHYILFMSHIIYRQADKNKNMNALS